MERKIIVVTAAFGADVVYQAGGQRYFIPIIAQSGADGVEIRRELLSSAVDDELIDLKSLIEEQGLFSYYSVPESLFTAPGTINPRLEHFQHEAALLNARAIKFALGAGAGSCAAEHLAEQLAGCRIPLLIENDQTATGKIQPMLDYFNHHHPLPTVQGMTFDMANWLWVDESPNNAAKQLAPYVAYCHVKAAVKTDACWQAISLDHSQGEWRSLLSMMPEGVPLGIEFPLEGGDIAERVHYYVGLLRAA
ncbi:sugar phosphate isomerase/epimerase family protein [Rosenbergiella epipactidis]|uniref:sugar phosphate isomerase/epimerase family protein n=1 Tax=Rosenbergiella epipactidis TaxID=1544694 RepID=UPI001F4D3F9C|nr:sugar phosphate isomerase/epimerase [Rosenbergiella epipactidis]